MPMFSQKFRRTGFTLVEILMVVTIISILGVSIASSFVSGIRIWRYASDVSAKDSGFLVGILECSRDFHQALEPMGNVSFQGDSRSVTFPAINNDEIFRISYFFDSQTKKVFRSRLPLKRALKESSLLDGDKQFLFSAQDFSLSYFIFDSQIKKHVWVDEIKEIGEPFKAIKISAKIKSNNYEQVIFLPIVEGNKEFIVI